MKRELTHGVTKMSDESEARYQRIEAAVKAGASAVDACKSEGLSGAGNFYSWRMKMKRLKDGSTGKKWGRKASTTVARGPLVIPLKETPSRAEGRAAVIVCDISQIANVLEVLK